MTMLNNHWIKPKELHIPVPFGHIAAKVWGNEGLEPVLALHGLQDNAGTFDELIPLLTSKLHIVAIDFPGHGLSSHRPVGAFYHFMEIVLDVKRVITYLKWNRFSFITHSMGGTIALMYASIFPEEIKNLVSIELVNVTSKKIIDLPNIARSGIESFLEIEKKMYGSAPVYSMKEAKARLVKGMFDEITSKSADVLLKRGCKPSECGKGVIFSRDIRLKTTEEIHNFSHDDVKEFMRRLKCNMFIIFGNQSVIFKSRTPDVESEFITIYKEYCKSFKVVRVDGNHFVHLNNPDRVAPYIDEFFAEQLKKLSKI